MNNNQELIEIKTIADIRNYFKARKGRPTGIIYNYPDSQSRIYTWLLHLGLFLRLLSALIRGCKLTYYIEKE